MMSHPYRRPLQTTAPDLAHLRSHQAAISNETIKATDHRLKVLMQSRAPLLITDFG